MRANVDGSEGDGLIDRERVSEGTRGEMRGGWEPPCPLGRGRGVNLNTSPTKSPQNSTLSNFKRSFAQCGICKSNKLAESVSMTKVGKQFYSACPECIEDLKLTRRCLENGANFMCTAKRFKGRYAKVNPITVTCLD